MMLVYIDLSLLCSVTSMNKKIFSLLRTTKIKQYPTVHATINLWRGLRATPKLFLCFLCQIGASFCNSVHQISVAQHTDFPMGRLEITIFQVFWLG